MSLLFTWLAPLLVSGALLIIFTITVTNARAFPRLRPQPTDQPPADELPGVAVLVPARNEASRIAGTVTSLLTQEYPCLQVYVLDDNSDDETGEISTAAAKAVLDSPEPPAWGAHAGGREDHPNSTAYKFEPISAAAGEPIVLPPCDRPGTGPSFRLLHGQPLPQGWLGKNWACHQLAAAALAGPHSPAILIFTDADVHWEPDAVAAVVAEMQRSDADLLSVWPTQITVSWGERLTVPLMALVVLGYLPLRLAHDFYHPLAAAANGQCMVFRHAAYTALGGHAAVRNQVVEDVRLAQRIKATGHKLRMADANGRIACRMYEGSHAAFDGYAKSILGGFGNRVSLLLLSTVFHWAVFLWPALWLIFGATWSLPFWPLWPLALTALGIGSRAVAAGATRQRIGDALLMPISVLLMTYIAFRAIWWRWRFGGVLWKGRVLRNT